ncbi:MAG TPA: hypothetical protein VIM58_01700 [Candidatus Methylacidiphilales bacterium]
MKTPTATWKTVLLLGAALAALGEGHLSAQSYLVHFGQSTTPALGTNQTIVEAGVTYSSSNVTTDPNHYWNDILATGQGFLPAGTTSTTQYTSTTTLSNLVSTAGAASGISVAMGGSYFSGYYNANGPTSGGPYIGNATASSIVGTNAGNMVITIAGLVASDTYNFTIYASRGTVSDVRSGLYTFTGANSGSGIYDAGNNVSNTLTISGIAPTASGSVTLTISTAATNTNSTGFFYLGDLQIDTIAAAVPEPAPSFLLAAGGVVLLALARLGRPAAARIG